MREKHSVVLAERAVLGEQCFRFSPRYPDAGLALMGLSYPLVHDITPGESSISWIDAFEDHVSPDDLDSDLLEDLASHGIPG
jgi:hypothetical protein